ncbi:MAG TPA: FecR domain-containing protein [Pyrinomonadaceae bacterium]|jgi:hypothetical protein|nr:FecR domain-containing protein [Pyrinomonadaceae bacterium]
MTLKQRKGFKALALILAFSVMQIGVQASLAGPNGSAGNAAAAPAPQAITARLTTRGNQAILVNGNSVSTGASILTGATIETGDQVGATINLGPLGSLDLAPNTKIQLDYDDKGNVRVKLIQGCAILRTKKNANGQIDTDQGTAGKNDKATGGALDVCFPQGSSQPVVNQGAAANAGAGAGGGSAAAAPTAAGTAAGGLFGLGTAADIAIIGGAAAAAIGIPIALHRGGNSSPSTP